MTESVNSVKAVILTGIELELEAVRAHLTGLRVVQHPDGPLFEVGTIAGTSVGVALAMTGMGNASPAFFVDRAVAWFKPQMILLVGLAGSLHPGLTLGDVVVGTRIYRAEPERVSPSQPKMRPRSFESTLSLIQWARYLARTSWWAYFPGQTDEHPEFGIHFRPIVSVETLVRSQHDADYLRERYVDAFAVDLESADMLHSAAFNSDLRVLVIRGISDIAGDLRRSDGSQELQVAAARAALFALAVIASFEIGPVPETSAVPQAESEADPQPQSEAEVDDGLVRTLRTMGHGDRATRTDLLARDAFVDSLAELLSHRSPQSTEEDGAGPTVIAIEGSWGAGKSSLMEMVRIRLDGIGSPPDITPSSDIPLWRRLPSRAWETAVERWRQRRVRAWDADAALGGWQPARRLLHRIGNWFPRRPIATPWVLTATLNPWSYVTSEQVWAGLNKEIVCTGAPVVAGQAGSSLQRFWFAHNVEQLDRRQIQRTLRKRIVSPLLRLGVFALPVPILAQLIRNPVPVPVFGRQVEPFELAIWITGLLLLTGFAHTLVRYLFRPADTLLPTELFGPLGTIGAHTAIATADDPLRDPHYRALEGELRVAHNQIHSLLRKMDDGRLVVFIDDLDRCSPRITADVFEAINVFLAESFPKIRFVLGIDAAAVAAHLDAAYQALAAADAGRNNADPSPGWTYLRKLIQLPFPLPRVLETQVEPLLDGLLGPVQQSIVTGSSATAPAAAPEHSERTQASSAPPASTDNDARATGEIVTTPTVLALEHDVRVRERMAERLRAQPDLSVREAKRILTIWQFYVRVVDRLHRLAGTAAVERARHLVILAEVVARWPASQRNLHQRLDGRHGLALLAAAAEDDVKWAVETDKLGLTGDKHKAVRTGLRKLLRAYEGEKVAELAEQLT